MARISLRILSATGALCALLGITGCAQQPDPVETRESLEQAAQTDGSAGDPEPAEQPGEYDIQAFPEPIVEALPCTPYLVVTARGTGEPTRGQLLSPVARAIEEARPDAVATVDVDYPADTDVNDGGARGVRWLLDTLRVQSEACPLQHFVLLGYSQGALVVGDALAAPSQRVIGAEAGELDEGTAERVAAVVLYGNPRFEGEEPYNAGGFSPGLDGILPRPLGGLARFADRLRDYCEASDFICQASFNLDEQGHVAYYENGMQQDGAAFAITLLDPVGIG